MEVLLESYLHCLLVAGSKLETKPRIYIDEKILHSFNEHYTYNVCLLQEPWQISGPEKIGVLFYHFRPANTFLSKW